MPKEMQNSFSIIIPTCERPNITIRAVRSVLDQLYQDFEIILVDDGSEKNVKDSLNKFVKVANDPRLKIVHHEKRMQRLIARNTGIKASTKEWILHLDSDDEYSRIYLNCADWAIKEYPEYKCFNFGAMVYGIRGHHTRTPYDIGDDNTVDGEAMNRFRSGTIGMGSFFYKREIHDDIGYYPEVGHHDQLADFAKEKFPYFMEWAGPKSAEMGRPLGNPFGDDFFLIYSITRKYKSKMLPLYMYQQFVRRCGFIEQDNDSILNIRSVFEK